MKRLSYQLCWLLTSAAFSACSGTAEHGIAEVCPAVTPLQGTLNYPQDGARNIVDQSDIVVVSQLVQGLTSLTITANGQRIVSTTIVPIPNPLPTPSIPISAAAAAAFKFTMFAPATTYEVTAGGDPICGPAIVFGSFSTK